MEVFVKPKIVMEKFQSSENIRIEEKKHKTKKKNFDKQ